MTEHWDMWVFVEHYHTSISTNRAAKNNRVAHSTLWSMISKSWMSASTSNHRAPKIAIQPEGQNSTSSRDHWKRTKNTVHTDILFPVVARKGFKIMESWKTADWWLMQCINHMLCLYLSCLPMTTNTFSSADHSGPKSGIPLTQKTIQREREQTAAFN